MRPRGRDWSGWRIQERQNLAKFSYVPTRREFPDTPTFAAQNCIYIQAVGGDMLHIKHQNGFVMLAGPRETHPAIPVKYARKGVPERTTGSWTRGEFAK